MKIVHLGSKVTTFFGVLHDSGDVTDAEQFEFNLPSLTEKAFSALLPHFEEKRAEKSQLADSLYLSSEPAPVPDDTSADEFATLAEPDADFRDEIITQLVQELSKRNLEIASLKRLCP